MTNYLSESVGVFLYIGRGTLQMLFSPKYVVKINKKTFQNSLTSVAGRSTHQRFLEQSSSKFYVLRYVVRHQFLVTTDHILQPVHPFGHKDKVFHQCASSYVQGSRKCCSVAVPLGGRSPKNTEMK